jgi:hypothetical protein
MYNNRLRQSRMGTEDEREPLEREQWEDVQRLKSEEPIRRVDWAPGEKAVGCCGDGEERRA